MTTFWKAHPDAETPLKVWRRMMRAHQYETPHEIRAHFPAADFLKGGITVFDIGGNKYRLVVTIRYDMGRVYIRHVLTHDEYDERTADGSL
ncbi:type II toxin-antitoxin system HigB family toxin [Longimicrobium terrae]|uniref:mRNA interferase HigB n=1 Tax=Longimicrobium terrae TaxID=1639882 RepID=A0A841GRP5_9BACT|nr:type II toxin-antitoxin system HigB family toxin [Longimicrobium terrae]MBB4635436.1 mRNA interferase HigB [Longimicrobium terrae]MBB6069830.1 mRNA interferase HigB [Longimicrobium terrae]